MAKLFVFITFCIFELYSLCLNIPIIYASHLCPFHQTLSLLNFKDTLEILTYDDYMNIDPTFESKISSWNSSTDCCSWEGITCDEFTGHVNELDLSSSELTGVIHSNSSIFQLSHLRTLNLAYNHLQGELSPEFRRFTHLSQLNLTGTKFEGQIPFEISQLNQLVSLDLSYNSGLIVEPRVIKLLLQNMTRLRELYLSGVHIESSLPKNLSSSLTIIDLSDTSLNGTFPYHIFHLPNVQQISLSRNHFHGFVNSESVKWNSSYSLQKLELSDVNFPGKFVETIVNLNGLTYLNLSSCALNGTLPKSFGNLTQLTHLDLSNNQFSGQIPQQILGLEHLTLLNLHNNNLDILIPHLSFNNMKMLKALTLSSNKLTSSSVSPTLANLTQLEIIDLSYNPLFGPIPIELCEIPSLQHINLEQAQLYGSIPNSFSNLVNLEYLNIYFNNITGPIETKTFSNIINLEYLNLASNNLSGPIFETKTLINLEYLNLASNNFTGPLEIDALYNLVNLRTLDLSSNSFGITLDLAFISNLKSIWYIDLSFSSLELIKEYNTTLPKITIDHLGLASCNIRDLDILRSIKVLRKVYLSNNNIHGELSEWVWSNWSNVYVVDISNNFITHIVGNKIPLQYLEYLNLGSNWLKGQLPILPTSIWTLDLSSNQFHGEIKPSICNLVGNFINLSNNSLSGALPHCIGIMMSGLDVLDLHMNNLQGSIFDTFTMNSWLRGLNLRGNQFEGKVPRSLINCSELEFLDLSENNLNDTFPTWLGNLPQLGILNLRSNMFYGPISINHASTTAFSALQILDLSYNQFTGNLPSTLFLRLYRMMSVASLYVGYLGDDYPIVSYNYEHYSEEYHDSMAMVLKGNMMQVERISRYRVSMDFSCNHFVGRIPNSIGGLSAIQQLNLSHNNFTGQIPSQIGNLSHLESLDLSSNQLDGNIPDKFASLGFLSTMNLSNNRLTGRIPSGPQLQAIPNDSYTGNDGLCGFPLSIRCGKHEPSMTQPPQGGVPDEEDEQEFFDGLTWQSVVIGYSVGICIGLVIGSMMLVTGKPKWLIRMVEEEAHRMIGKYKRRNRVILTWNRTS